MATNAQSVEAEDIMLRSDGTAVVKLLVKLDSGVNEVVLPADPIVASLTVSVNGEIIPAIYEEGILYIVVGEPSDAVIEYLVSLNTTDQGVEFTYSPLTGQAKLIIEPGVVLLGLPADVIDYYEDDSKLVILFGGASLVRYIVAPERPPDEQQPPPETTQPEQETQQIVETNTPIGGGEGQATQEMQPQERLGSGQLLLLVAATAIAIVAGTIAALLYLRRNRGKRIEEPRQRDEGYDWVDEVEDPHRLELGDVDLKILEALKDAGGEMLQSELQRVLGLPKTTVWRHVQKLRNLGYIEVRREGKTNRLVLKRNPPGEGG